MRVSLSIGERVLSKRRGWCHRLGHRFAKEGLTDFGPLTDIGLGKEEKAVGEGLKQPLRWTDR